MLDFPLIQDFGKSFQMQELTGIDILSIVQIPERYQERRLSVFLDCILGKKNIGATLTLQERYFLLLKYLEKQNNTILQIETDIDEYFLKEPCSTWNVENTNGSISVRQLVGRDLEYIEKNCNQPLEILYCFLALQYKDTESEHELLRELVPFDLSDTDYFEQVKKRFLFLFSLTASDISKLYDNYFELNKAFSTHLNTVHTLQGVAIYKKNGGTDDAPTRFRTSLTFPRFIKDMEK